MFPYLGQGTGSCPEDGTQVQKRGGILMQNILLASAALLIFTIGFFLMKQVSRWIKKGTEEKHDLEDE